MATNGIELTHECPTINAIDVIHSMQPLWNYLKQRAAEWRHLKCMRPFNEGDADDLAVTITGLGHLLQPKALRLHVLCRSEVLAVGSGEEIA